MQKVRTTLIAVLAVVTCLLVLAASAREQLVVGVARDLEPLAWVDEDGRLQGFDVDLVKAVGEQAGLDVAFRVGSRDELNRMLQSGEIDASFLIYSPDRDAELDFATHSLILYWIAVTRRGAAPVERLDDLSGKRVAVVRSSLMHDHLRTGVAGVELVPVGEERDALQSVADGDADVALVIGNGAHRTLRHSGIQGLTAASPPLLPGLYGLVVTNERPSLLSRVNRAQAELKTSGRYQEIYDNWFQPVAEGLTWRTLGRYLLWALLPILLLSAAVAAWIWTLRRQVAIKTSHLRRELTERKRAEERLRYHASYDVLTGLTNRNMLLSQLERMVATARREDRLIGVLVVDLDRFKTVNDSLGHRAGDDLLKAVAGRLRRFAGDENTVARLGSDEFVVLLEHVEREAQVMEATEALLKELDRPYPTAHGEIYLGASIGVAMFPRDGDSGARLMRNANAALERAKLRGRSRFEFYSPDLNQEAMDRLQLDKGLRDALQRNELMLFYQPQIDLSSGKLIGVEALLRWHHAERGPIPPDRFIPIAEDSGLIINIGEWVLRAAAEQSAVWSRLRSPPRQIAVNLSARQFWEPGLPALVETTLRNSDVPAERLKLEITEGALMHDLDGAVRTMTKLRDMGVGLSIDDFGTGYSSLSYLRRFPADQLKLDRSFVQDITRNDDDAAITAAVIALAHQLNLRVVAEGVETEEQLDLLRKQGCDWVQGYYSGRPMPAADVEKIMAANWH